MRHALDWVLRRHPVAVLVAVLAVGIAIPADVPYLVLALVPLFGTAVHRPRWMAAAAALAIVAAAVLHGVLWGEGGGIVEAVATAALAAAVAATGVAVAERRRGEARELALLAERAAAEERLRIARELHDAVGHDVSLMVVQAQALGATSADERVREATDSIAALGRRTMGEMHRTLRILREGDEDPALAPAPGLAALDTILDDARAAGVDVTVAMEGPPRELAPALDASAFRIVQEAVTNVVRHAEGAPATVTLRYLPDALELVVADNGSGDGDDMTAPGGHGLVGMRERAALFGGTLQAGTRAEGGFEVRALLPYPEEAAR